MPRPPVFTSVERPTGNWTWIFLLFFKLELVHCFLCGRLEYRNVSHSFFLLSGIGATVIGSQGTVYGFPYRNARRNSATALALPKLRQVASAYIWLWPNVNLGHPANFSFGEIQKYHLWSVFMKFHHMCAKRQCQPIRQWQTWMNDAWRIISQL